MNLKNVPQAFTSVGGYLVCSKISFFEKLLVIAFVAAYIISPIDLIWDIPVIGWIDDIGVGALFMAYCSWRLDTVKEQEKAEKEKLQSAAVSDNVPQKEVVDAAAIPENLPIHAPRKNSAEKSIFTIK